MPNDTNEEKKIEVTLYINDKNEVIGTPDFDDFDDYDLDQDELAAIVTKSGYVAYVNDTGFRDRLYINIAPKGDYIDGGDSFEIDAGLPSQRRLMRALENASLCLVLTPSGDFIITSNSEYNSKKVEAEIQQDGDTYKVLKILDAA